MNLVVAVALLVGLWFGSDHVSGTDKQLYKNIKSDRCPNGNVFRANCKLCFCIELHTGHAVTKCKSKFSEKICAAVTGWSHCETHNLQYDYKWECEGDCSCNAARNLTVCENLPCDDTLLWFHGYYNTSEKGHMAAGAPDDGNVDDSNDGGNRANEVDGFIEDNAHASRSARKGGKPHNRGSKRRGKRTSTTTMTIGEIPTNGEDIVTHGPKSRKRLHAGGGGRAKREAVPFVQQAVEGPSEQDVDTIDIWG